MTTRAALANLPIDNPLRAENALINIKMVRLSSGVLDSDNLPASMKYLRDGIADALAPGLAPGRADGLGRFSWTYNQRKNRRKDSRIEVTLSLYTINTARDFNPTLLYTKKEAGYAATKCLGVKRIIHRTEPYR